jgi:hypothetical protein
MKTRILRVLILLTVGTGIFTGCGGAAYREQDTLGNIPGGQSSSNPDSSNGGDSSGGSTGSGYTGFAPALTFSFSITGSSGGTSNTTPNPTFTTGSINTDNTLRVRITPGPAGSVNTSSGSNYSQTYNCAAFTITLLNKNGNVIGSGIQTKALAVNSGSALCDGASKSQTIDLSGYLSQGHGALRVQVSGARYDTYCMWLLSGVIPIPYPWTYQQAYQTYCSSSLYPALAQHTVTGTVEVETNGTDGF